MNRLFIESSRQTSVLKQRRMRLTGVLGGLLTIAMLLWPNRRVQGAEPASGVIARGEMSGYLNVPNESAPAGFDAGFSMYVAAWPLLKQYPGDQFQSGLFSTWMFAKLDQKPAKDLYSDIEGGLGWWRDTRFATETPKFIMGGVAPNFVEWANGPGAGKDRDWSHSAGKYGVAQLSPWVLWPPDGLNLKQGTCGELLGYGYLPLPLTEAKPTTDGKPVPTGGQSWTLFLNSANFKGPVAFFTPHFWSHTTIEEPEFAGLLLDSRPTDPHRHLSVETQHIPAAQVLAENGVGYARIATTCFPRAADGDTVLVHRITSYSKRALWDDVQKWFAGGPAVSGAINPQAGSVHRFAKGGGATWQLYPDGVQDDQKVSVAWDRFAQPVLLADDTFGYRWQKEVVQPSKIGGAPIVTLPEFYRLEPGKEPRERRWVPVAAKEVPESTGLKQVDLAPQSKRPAREPYETPDDPASCWKTPGPVAGPFTVRLGDGSRVTYAWYRFADQPALLNAGLSDEEREVLQKRVELLHRRWKPDQAYLPPPTVGTLAALDPALLVKPPKGFEAGYVPIVIRQEGDDEVRR